MTAALQMPAHDPADRSLRPCPRLCWLRSVATYVTPWRALTAISSCRPRRHMYDETASRFDRLTFAAAIAAVPCGVPGRAAAPMPAVCTRMHAGRDRRARTGRN